LLYIDGIKRKMYGQNAVLYSVTVSGTNLHSYHWALNGFVSHKVLSVL